MDLSSAVGRAVIPSVVARQVRETILDYLRTTFALADPDFERALFAFLDSDAGLFKGPYVDVRLSTTACSFEFLGLKPAEVVSESDLQHALVDRLQAFLLEMGRGFCFEARQKRILIGGEHFFVDLV